MNSAIPLELQSTLVELEDRLKFRYSDIASNPLVYFLQELSVSRRVSLISGRGLFEYSGEIGLLANRTFSILRDPSVDRITLDSVMTNFHKLKAHEERLNAAISAERKTLTARAKRRTLDELQSERRDKLKVIALLLARVSPASQKVEEHYLKSVLFRKGQAGMQEVYTLIEQLPELTEARNEVFLRPSQEAFENYLRHAELAPTLRDVKELFNGDVGLTQADWQDYSAGLEKLQDELHVAVLVNGV